jgi:hypothetical protein
MHLVQFKMRVATAVAEVDTRQIHAVSYVCLPLHVAGLLLLYDSVVSTTCLCPALLQVPAQRVHVPHTVRGRRDVP